MRSNQCDTQRRTPVHSPLQQPSITYHPDILPATIPTIYTTWFTMPSTEEMHLESQNKVVKMVENVSKQLGDLEKVVSVLTPEASDSVGQHCQVDMKNSFSTICNIVCMLQCAYKLEMLCVPL